MAFLVSVMIGGGRQYIAILIPFMSLRQYCGGYHAKNAWVCMISSFVTLVLAVWIAMQDIDCSVYRISVIVAFIIIVKNSPIESENRKLDEDEKIVYRKKAIILACFIVFIIVVFDIIGLNKYSDAIGIGTVLVAGSQLLYIIELCISIILEKYI